MKIDFFFISFCSKICLLFHQPHMNEWKEIMNWKHTGRIVTFCAASFVTLECLFPGIVQRIFFFMVFCVLIAFMAVPIAGAYREGFRVGIMVSGLVITVVFCYNGPIPDKLNRCEGEYICWLQFQLIVFLTGWYWCAILIFTIINIPEVVSKNNNRGTRKLQEEVSKMQPFTIIDCDCFICHMDTPPLVQRACLCKNMPVHKECWSRWLSLKRSDQLFICDVCNESWIKNNLV